MAGALIMLWPAICNGYPLLYPDSISYLRDGGPLMRILLLHSPKGYMAMRSEIYSVGIYSFHWNISAWPIVVMQAVVVAYVMWLVVRALRATSMGVKRLAVQYLVLVGGLSLTTSLGWYVCFVMPDNLGPVLYLCIYLLVFVESLSFGERFLVVVIAGWAAAAHSTHLMLAVGIFAMLTLLWIVRWTPMKVRGRALAGVGGLLLVVAGGQIALHGYLYGKPSLYGNHMPYLTARVVADGPGRWYLRAHCGELQWAICGKVNSLPDNDDEFLWSDGGVWSSASPAMQQRMLKEEIPLVIAAVRAYPVEQMQRSYANFWQEFTDFGLWDFQQNSWMQSQINLVLRDTESTYQATREARSTLPVVFFSGVLNWVVCISAVAIALALPLLWRRGRWQVLGLGVIVIPTVVANAVLTAVLSESDSRYQSRLIWLVPMVAGILLIDLLNSRFRGVPATDGAGIGA